MPAKDIPASSITYRHIRTHDRRAHLVAYLHPDTVEMLTGKKTPSRRDLVAVAVDLRGPDLAQRGERRNDLWTSVGEGHHTRWWDTWNRKTIGRAILPLTQTPFLAIWADHYPQVKPE